MLAQRRGQRLRSLRATRHWQPAGHVASTGRSAKRASRRVARAAEERARRPACDVPIAGCSRPPARPVYTNDRYSWAPARPLYRRGPRCTSRARAFAAPIQDSSADSRPRQPQTTESRPPRQCPSTRAKTATAGADWGRLILAPRRRGSRARPRTTSGCACAGAASGVNRGRRAPESVCGVGGGS